MVIHVCTVLDTACLIMLCVLPGVYWIQPVCLCTVEYCSHYRLVYTHSVPSYSYIRNGSTTTTLHDMQYRTCMMSMHKYLKATIISSLPKVNEVKVNS